MSHINQSQDLNFLFLFYKRSTERNPWVCLFKAMVVSGCHGNVADVIATVQSTPTIALTKNVSVKVGSSAPDLFSSYACLTTPQSQATKPYRVHFLIVYCVLLAHVHFCQFDQAEATVYSITLQSQAATLILLFSSSDLLAADILVYCIGKIIQTCRWWELNP